MIDIRERNLAKILKVKDLLENFGVEEDLNLYLVEIRLDESIKLLEGEYASRYVRESKQTGVA